MPVVWSLAALVMLLLWSEGTGWRLGVCLTKPLASATFVVLALQLGGMDTGYGLWVLAGLMACWIGDVLLIPNHRVAFKVGIVAFLLGHVLYSIAFLFHGVALAWAFFAAVPLGAMVWTLGRFLLQSVVPGLRTPVSSYILVISGMVALGIGAWARSGDSVFVLAPTAFYVSDLAVARNRFLRPGFVNRLVGLPLYYLAQVLFAWSVTLG